ncbi:MAG: hypothetical protein LDLANPLL_02491 [Turneriella sp.]|nr:hypothetical protein [Turneriella sp.]
MVENEAPANAAVPKLLFVKHLSKIALFYFIGLSIFFISGFLVFKILFADTEKAIVPDVVGRLFLGEHNKLRDDFKVELKAAYLLEYPYGYILAQDLSPGKTVDKNTKLELLVNLSDAVVQVPKLVGLSEALVDGSIQSLPVGGRVFSLRKGIATYVPSAQPKREVLSQFPPAGTPVLPNTPISLLISDGPQIPPQASLQQKIEKGTPVAIALGAAYYLKIPATIKLTKTEKADENAKLLADAKFSKDTVELEIGEFTEVLQKGKSPLGLKELPYTQLFVPAKKWGDEGATLTIARKEKILGDDGSPYSEYYFVKNTSALPIFRQRDDTFDVFHDHYVFNSVKPVAKEQEQVKTIVGATSSQAPIAEKPRTPDKSVRLTARTL